MAEERIPLIETVDLKKYFKVGDKSFLHAVDEINMKYTLARLSEWSVSPVAVRARWAAPFCA